MWKALGLAVALTAMPAGLRASVPPADWRPPTYTGPGVFCGDGFNLQLESGEVAVVGFPSEGYHATVVRSHGGAFAVTSYAFNRPLVEKTLSESSDLGRVYVVDRMVRDAASGIPKRRSYWFEPRAISAPPFTVDFFAAVEGQRGWGEFPPADYAGVVRRVSFAAPGQAVQCLAPTPAN